MLAGRYTIDCTHSTITAWISVSLNDASAYCIPSPYQEHAPRGLEFPRSEPIEVDSARPVGTPGRRVSASGLSFVDERQNDAAKRIQDVEPDFNTFPKVVFDRCGRIERIRIILMKGELGRKRRHVL